MHVANPSFFADCQKYLESNGKQANFRLHHHFHLCGGMVQYKVSESVLYQYKYARHVALSGKLVAFLLLELRNILTALAPLVILDNKK